MSAIPCPKCNSRSTHIAKIRGQYIGQIEDIILSCQTCGKRIYGRDQVDALVAQRDLAVQALAEARREIEERILAEELAHQAKLKAEAEAAAVKVRREKGEVKILAAAKCAWPPCPNDHTMTSKYCSRLCKDRNAHAREKERKLAARASAT